MSFQCGLPAWIYEYPSFQGLSFTQFQFAYAYYQDNTPELEAMIDELIANGLCVIDWIQASVPRAALDFGLISRVEPIEDDEPSPNWCGMSFSLELFLSTGISAADELLLARPDPLADLHEDGIEVFPTQKHPSIQMLGRFLTELGQHSITAEVYLPPTRVSRQFGRSALYVMMLQLNNGIVHLGRAILSGRAIQALCYCFSIVMNWEERETGRTIVQDLFWEYVILAEFIFPYQDDVLARYAARKAGGVSSLPGVDVSTIPQDEMRCPICLCDFDDSEEDLDHTPVVAPCGSERSHRFCRDCLFSCLSRDAAPICPLCRQHLSFGVEVDFYYGF